MRQYYNLLSELYLLLIFSNSLFYFIFCIIIIIIFLYIILPNKNPLTKYFYLDILIISINNISLFW